MCALHILCKQQSIESSTAYVPWRERGWVGGAKIFQTKLYIIVVQTPMKFIQKVELHNCTCSREGGWVDGWVQDNCCANTNETYTKSCTSNKCTIAHVPGRVRGWVDGVQVAEPAPRRSVAAPPLERRKPQSYFLFSQFFGFTSFSEQLIGYIYSCRICSAKWCSSINYPLTPP